MEISVLIALVFDTSATLQSSGFRRNFTGFGRFIWLGKVNDWLGNCSRRVKGPPPPGARNRRKAHVKIR